MNSKTVGKNLKYLRKTKDMSYDHFSQYFNVGEAALRKWESGNGITLTTAIKYSKEFKISLDDLCFKELSIN
jgi:DNA-binding transcriptional regulator YiaG